MIMLSIDPAELPWKMAVKLLWLEVLSAVHQFMKYG